MDRGRIVIIAVILALILLAKGIGKPEAKQGQFAPVTATPTPLATPCPVDEIKKLISKHDIDPKVVKAIIKVESNWNPDAKGSSGELGLMQLMPATAKHFGVKNRLNPFQNVKGGIEYLAYCKQKTGKAYLRCYNAGEAKTELAAAYKYEKKVLAALSNSKLAKNS